MEKDISRHVVVIVSVVGQPCIVYFNYGEILYNNPTVGSVEQPNRRNQVDTNNLVNKGNGFYLVTPLGSKLCQKP